MAGFDSADDVLLRVIAGPSTGRRIRIPEDGLVLGRSVEGPGRVPEDPHVSRTHAEIRWDQNGSLYVQDLGSTEGTYVNEKRIPEAWDLFAGDQVQIGGTTFVVTTSRRAPPAANGREPEPSYQVDQRLDRGGGVNVGRDNMGYIDAHRERIKIKVDDPYSRWARARGPAKVAIVLGLLLAIAGFGVFGYPIIAAGGDMAATQQAQNACYTKYPELGQKQVDCVIKAGQAADAARPDRSQLTTVGAILFFAGFVVSSLGYFLPGADPDRKKPKRA